MIINMYLNEQNNMSLLRSFGYIDNIITIKIKILPSKKRMMLCRRFFIGEGEKGSFVKIFVGEKNNKG